MNKSDFAFLKNLLPFLQIIVASLLVVVILLQKGSGELFSKDTSFYSTFRGVEKKLFWLTAILAILFVVLGIGNLWL